MATTLAIQDWLRSTRVGLCNGRSERRDGADIDRDDCEAGSEGVWEATGASNTWPRLAQACLAQCARCSRCHHLSLSYGLDQCRWFHSCDVLLDENATVGMLPPSPLRPWLFRSGHVHSHQKLLHQRGSASIVVQPADFLRVAVTGTCGRVDWAGVGDCESGVAGAFRVRGNKKRWVPNRLGIQKAVVGSPWALTHDRASWSTLLEACLPQCKACAHCQVLSVSFKYGVCTWFHRSVCPARLHNETFIAYHNPKPVEGQRSYWFRTAFVDRSGGGFTLASSRNLTAEDTDADAGCGKMRDDGFPVVNESGPCHRREAPLAVEGPARYDLPASAISMPSGPGSERAALPSNPAGSESAAERRLLLVTTTYTSDSQLTMLSHLAHDVLANVTNLLWIVAEDAAVKSEAVATLLRRSGLPFEHLAIGPTRRKGHEQRNLAYERIRSQALSGVVYNMDDDNEYSPALWNELRRVMPGRVGVLAVQMDEEGFLERPRYDEHGRFNGYDGGWCHGDGWTASHLGPRFFCVDMGGFAFSAELLQRKRGKLWDYNGTKKLPKLRHSRRRRGRDRAPAAPSRIEWRGGETEFLESLIPDAFPEDLQPLGNCGHDVLVFHNGFFTRVPPTTTSAKLSKFQKQMRRRSILWKYEKWRRRVHAPPLPCKSDGW